MIAALTSRGKLPRLHFIALISWATFVRRGMAFRPAKAAWSCQGRPTIIYRALASAPATSVCRRFPQPSRHTLPRRPFSSTWAKYRQEPLDGGPGKPEAISSNEPRETLPDDAGPAQDPLAESDTGRYLPDEPLPEPIPTEDAEVEAAALRESESNEAISGNTAALDSSNDSTPWFLEVKPPVPENTHKAELPKIPDNAPDLLEPIMKYVHEDMGLDELSLLDLRDLDPSPAIGHNLIMLFGTARSERHLHVSGGRLTRWLRRNYRIEANADGLIGAGELKTKLRRLRKKAKLMGTNSSIIPSGDNGISTGWICVNFTVDEGVSDESTSFDEGGRISGFGAARTGTTFVIQCLTESRRAELGLEDLWQQVLKQNYRAQRQVQGRSVSNHDLLDLVASKVQIKGTAAMQWQAMRTSAHQHRLFSTSARRLLTDAQPAMEYGSGAPVSALKPSLEHIAQHVRYMQATGGLLDEDVLSKYLSMMFEAPRSIEVSPTERLAMVDNLLLTAQERGLAPWSKDTLVELIYGVVLSPIYGPKLQKTQASLEYLLREMQVPLEDDQVLRLMAAYARCNDMPRFWDTFRWNSRFLKGRTLEQYVLVYRVVAALGDAQGACEALRWVYREQLRESPWIPFTDELWLALKQCILVADPATELLYKIRRATFKESALRAKKARLAHREMVVFYRHARKRAYTQACADFERRNPGSSVFSNKLWPSGRIPTSLSIKTWTEAT